MLWIAGRRRFITIQNIHQIVGIRVVDCGQAQVYYNDILRHIGYESVVDCGQAQVYYNAKPLIPNHSTVVDCGQAQVYYNAPVTTD